MSGDGAFGFGAARPSSPLPSLLPSSTRPAGGNFPRCNYHSLLLPLSSPSSLPPSLALLAETLDVLLRRRRDGMGWEWDENDDFSTLQLQPPLYLISLLSFLSAARMSMYRPPHWMTTATSTAAGTPLGATSSPTGGGAGGAEQHQQHHHWSSPPRTNASPTSPPPPPTSSAVTLPPTSSATIHPAAAPTAGYTTTTPGRGSSVE